MWVYLPGSNPPPFWNRITWQPPLLRSAPCTAAEPQVGFEKCILAVVYSLCEESGVNSGLVYGFGFTTMIMMLILISSFLAILINIYIYIYHDCYHCYYHYIYIITVLYPLSTFINHPILQLAPFFRPGTPVSTPRAPGSTPPAAVNSPPHGGRTACWWSSGDVAMKTTGYVEVWMTSQLGKTWEN